VGPSQGEECAAGLDVGRGKVLTPSASCALQLLPPVSLFFYCPPLFFRKPEKRVTAFSTALNVERLAALIAAAGEAQFLVGQPPRPMIAAANPHDRRHQARWRHTQVGLASVAALSRGVTMTRLPLFAFTHRDPGH